MTTAHPGTPPATTFEPLTADDPREVGGYRLSARLGVGGMGRVYLSYTPGGRPVALKVVRPDLAEDPEFRRRFAQEVASARRIHELYTAQVVDAGVDAPLPWLATTYVAGPSLHQVVHRYGPLPQRTTLLLMAGIAEALQAIHAAGVVHRDLKPANVLIAADGPRVIDFGIARAADAAALTGTGLRIGSPGFMAPEQALGRGTSPATDVFALGALAVYVASGTGPFGDGPESSALYRAVHEEPRLGHVPAELQELLWHCLAKNPEARPTTARVIEAAHHGLGGQLRFGNDWLPHRVSTEIRSRAELPRVPAPAPTRYEPIPDRPTHPAADPPTARAPRPEPADASPPAPSGPSGPSGPASPRRRGVRTALVATAALLVGAGGALVLLDAAAGDGQDLPDGTGTSVTAGPPSGAAPAPSPSATGVPGYTGVYAGSRLTSPDQTYEFDLRAGTVVPQDTAGWYLGRSADEFTVAEDTDAFVAPQGSTLTLADCVKGIESRPVTALPFGALRPGRTFCVRSRPGRDVGIVHVLGTAADGGPVTVSVDYYRHDG
ncbi:serine/threonine-protein kinase [Kitasatospora paranensis]|uniref:Serine/threonine-protein kinase n=1 Tax=Kitasatospora paranensis TaxID=258053 RepID=A0ABW2FYG1_9ACTN